MKKFLFIALFAALLTVGCDDSANPDDNLPPSEQTPDGDNNKPDDGDNPDDPNKPDDGDENDDPNDNPADIPDNVSNNELWYTSTDGKIVDPFNKDFGNGLKVVSNTYENGIGTLKFNAPVTTVAALAFYESSNLKSIIIPDIATSIGIRAFYNCSTLESVTIGNGVTLIKESAFENCTGMTSLTLGNSLQTIGLNGFQNCRSLTSVTIPDSITEIDNHGFDECLSLTSVYFRAVTPPRLYGYLFHHKNEEAAEKEDYERLYEILPNLKAIYVPRESVDAYKDAYKNKNIIGGQWWYYYIDLIVGYDF